MQKRVLESFGQYHWVVVHLFLWIVRSFDDLKSFVILKSILLIWINFHLIWKILKIIVFGEFKLILIKIAIYMKINSSLPAKIKEIRYKYMRGILNAHTSKRISTHSLVHSPLSYSTKTITTFLNRILSNYFKWEFVIKIWEFNNHF